MPDYQQLKKICDTNSKETADLLDGLMYYGGERDKLDHKSIQQLPKYRHMLKEFGNENMGHYTAQYIIHQIFKKKGYIHKYLTHSYCRNLKAEELVYLDFCAQNPWRYSFSVVKNQPAKEFFEMLDVFTGESYLLYSPGAEVTLKEQPVILWFNLICSNGHCYQSFGPIGAFAGFEPDDILFYTSLLCPDQWPLRQNQLVEYIEKNPLLYYFLIYGAKMPLTRHSSDQIIRNVAEYDCDEINLQELGRDFIIDSKRNITRMQLKNWDGPPHFSTAYFDEKNKLLQLSAMTDRGFSHLIKTFNKFDYDLDLDPDYRVNFSMISTAAHILKMDLSENKYAKLFQTKASPKEQKGLDRLNYFISLLVPIINEGGNPDIKSLAEKAEIDLKTAKELAEHLMGKLGRL